MHWGVILGRDVLPGSTALIAPGKGGGAAADNNHIVVVFNVCCAAIHA